MGSARVFGKIHEETATPTINTDAYAAGDLLGTLMAFTAITSEFKDDTSGNTKNVGSITKVLISDLAEQISNIDVVFFNDNPSGTTFTNNSELDIADADLPKICGVAHVTDSSSFADNAVQFASGGEIPIDFVLAGTTLYACLIVRSGTPTYAVGDIAVQIEIREY